MRDELILRLLEETCKGLEGVSFPVTTPHLMPTYRALAMAAAANHPENSFLQMLTSSDDRPPGEEGGSVKMGKLKFAFDVSSRKETGPEEMRILFGQLRIVLESLVESPR